MSSKYVPSSLLPALQHITGSTFPNPDDTKLQAAGRAYLRSSIHNDRENMCSQTGMHNLYIAMLVEDKATQKNFTSSTQADVLDALHICLSILFLCNSHVNCNRFLPWTRWMVVVLYYSVILVSCLAWKAKMYP
jgi:hypothetical protein